MTKRKAKPKPPGRPKRPKHLRDINHRAGDPYHLIYHCLCHPPSMGHDFLQHTLTCKCGIGWATQKLLPVPCKFFEEKITAWVADIPIDLLPEKWHSKAVAWEGQAHTVLELWERGAKTHERALYDE